uniref:Tripartite motif-containing protein 16-like n=1 Tax=Erpetoichthys calabaricus TaxID=27687 RepID=A0A8C4T2G2_ERPCA
MAEAKLFGLQNEITCFICQETLSDPVSILCGHSFCLKCLNDYWDQSHECSCPECRRTFTTRPELHRNTVLNELDHKLTDPDGNLKVELCVKHQKRLEIFCKNEETCICMMCALTEHEGHKKVELEMEKISVENELEENEKSFTDLICSIGKTQKKLTEKIREQEKTEMEKIEGVREELEKEIEELKGKDAELRELSETKDNNCFLQISSLVFFSLLSDFCPLTLDINTAHRDLHLSEGNKKVTHDDWTVTDYPDHPDRFDWSLQVLCREGLTGTRCYWEVECNECWVDIGVAYKGLSRKGWNFECMLGYNDKSWCLHYSQGHYSEYHTDRKMEISAPRSSRIGVYLDWPAGSLSFYSVSHTMTLLHRFSTTFTEPLYPGFSLNFNSSVTICHLTPCDH